MPETLLTVDEAAARLRIKPATLRSQLRAGRIASVRTGKMWRIPESALRPQLPHRAATPEERAAEILAALDSRDMKRRNAAIIQLTKSDARTVEIVTAAATRAVEEWDGPEDDLSRWRNADLKPHFPEEAPDYLDGLYRTDNADEKENV